MSSSGSFAELCKCFSNVDNVAFQGSFKVCLHPRSKPSREKGRLPRTLIISPRRSTVITGGRDKDRAALGDSTRVFWEAMVLPFFPKSPRYPECSRTSKLARRVLQLLPTKTLVMMWCPKGPKAAHA